jgi:hypothetical protein
MKGIPTLVLLAVILAFAPMIDSEQQKTFATEQVEFSAEDDGVEHPIDLPKGVIELLKKDHYILGTLEDENLTPDKLPTSWFWASEIHLAGWDEKDLVIIGRCPVCGANVSVFWIFRPKSDGYEMVLFTGAHNLRILKRHSSGYKEIETNSVTMQHLWTDRWRFDGIQYQTVHGNQ